MKIEILLKQIEDKITNSSYNKYYFILRPILDYIKLEVDKNHMTLYLDSDKDTWLILFVIDYERSITKISTYLNKVNKKFSLNFSKQAIALFAEIFGTTVASYQDCTFTIYKGQELSDQYNKLNINSCVVANPGIKLYIENPDKIELLVARSEEYVARVLLFHTDSGKTVLDRIYPNDSPLLDKIQKYGKQQGWVVRKSQRPDHNGFKRLTLDLANNPILEELTLKHIPGAYPYLDTFPNAVFNKEKNTVVLSSFAKPHQDGIYFSPNNKLIKNTNCSGCRKEDRALIKTAIPFYGKKQNEYDIVCKSCSESFFEFQGKLYFHATYYLENDSVFHRKYVAYDILQEKTVLVEREFVAIVEDHGTIRYRTDKKLSEKEIKEKLEQKLNVRIMELRL